MRTRNRLPTPYPFEWETFRTALACQDFDSSEVAAHPRAKYLFDYLSELGAQALLIEDAYTDRDYLDDFAAFYARCHREYPRYCKRIHFFSKWLDRGALRNLILGRTEATIDALSTDYLGFVVARPLPGAVIGRTVLRTYPSDGGRRNYRAIKPYSANLFGLRLECMSLAFQEQDRALAACATVALWSCFQQTAHLFGTPTLTPAEITRSATHFIQPARPIPSQGLDVAQICAAVKHVGLEPEVFQIKPNTPLVSLLYGHLEMRLPVLLGVHVEGVGPHAITLTGYSMRQSQHLDSEVAPAEQAIPMIGLRIDEFYGHDDQFGPFARIQVKPSEAYEGQACPVTFEGGWEDPQRKRKRRLYPFVAMVPVYHKVRMTFLDAQKWLTRLTRMLEVFLKRDIPMEWNLRLTTLNALRAEIRQIVGLGRSARLRMLVEPQPRFIWRATLTVRGVDLVELWLDATEMPKAFPLYEVVWRHDGFRAFLQAQLANSRVAAEAGGVLTERFFLFLRNRVSRRDDSS